MKNISKSRVSWLIKSLAPLIAISLGASATASQVLSQNSPGWIQVPEDYEPNIIFDLSLNSGIYNLGSRYIEIVRQGNRVCYEGTSIPPGRYALSVGETVGSLIPTDEAGVFIIPGWQDYGKAVLLFQEGEALTVVQHNEGYSTYDSFEYSQPKNYSEWMQECLRTNGKYFKTKPGYQITLSPLPEDSSDQENPNISSTFSRPKISMQCREAITFVDRSISDIMNRKSSESYLTTKDIKRDPFSISLWQIRKDEYRIYPTEAPFMAYISYFTASNEITSDFNNSKVLQQSLAQAIVTACPSVSKVQYGASMTTGTTQVYGIKDLNSRTVIPFLRVVPPCGLYEMEKLDWGSAFDEC